MPPRLDGLPVRIFYFSDAAFAAGVEEHRVEGIRVRVYCPAKTVADCFKYRNKIGLDEALEALRETWRARRATMDDLWRYATICRVVNVMRPYLEMVRERHPGGADGRLPAGERYPLCIAAAR